jgi:hypothetical protein
MSTIASGNTTSTAVVITGDTTGNLVFTTGGANTVALTLSNTQAATFSGTVTANSVVSTGTVNALNTFGFENRIINGNMVIDQRNSGANLTFNNNTYAVDRFRNYATQSSKGTWGRNLGAVTPPAGYTNYLGFTSTSAYSVAAGDYFTIIQKIEGYNVADLAFGTANAKTFTLSFWVRSSLTGTFGVAFNNADFTRSYPATYTISAANTWEYKTITVAGNTSGTWNTTTDTGLLIQWGLGVGSTYSGTPGSWANTEYEGATGATSVVGTNGATWYMTGAQLEVGSQATSFDFRDYGRELFLCQRYYQQILGSGYFASGVAISGGQVRGPRMTLLQTMRATPTIGLPSAGTGSGQLYYCNSGGSAASIGSISAQQLKQDSFFMECEGFNGLSAGNGSLLASGGGNATITISAEL